MVTFLLVTVLAILIFLSGTGPQRNWLGAPLEKSGFAAWKD